MYIQSQEISTVVLLKYREVDISRLVQEDPILWVSIHKEKQKRLRSLTPVRNIYQARENQIISNTENKLKNFSFRPSKEMRSSRSPARVPFTFTPKSSMTAERDGSHVSVTCTNSRLSKTPVRARIIQINTSQKKPYNRENLEKFHHKKIEEQYKSSLLSQGVLSTPKRLLPDARAHILSKSPQLRSPLLDVSSKMLNFA